MMTAGFANWSWRVGRLFRIEIRLHWTLLLLALFIVGLQLEHGTPAWWIPILVLIPVISVLLHEFGHSLTARAVGGESNQIIMWMFGGLAMCRVPPTPGKQFLVTAMGPVVTLVLAAGASAVIGGVPPPFGGDAFYFAAQERLGPAYPFFTAFAAINTYLLLFNLLPCYPLDGGSMLRSALWPMVGLRRAMVITIYCAYVVLIGLIAYSFATGDVFLGLLAIMLLFTVVQEHRMVQAGYDPYTGGAAGSGLGEDTWLDRKRRERASKRRAKDAAARQAVDTELDRLLEKVSRDGLPSLTPKERRFLDEYSKRNQD